MGCLQIVCGVLFLGIISLSSALKMDVTTTEGQMKYLKQYQYMGPQNPDPRVAALSDVEAMEQAIAQFQRFAGLPVTGVMDPATIAKMEQDRCGNPDMVTMGDMTMRRRKRYTLQGSRWFTNTLTYRYLNYSPDLSRADIEREIDRAFQVWADVSPLRFVKRRSGSVDIEILFGAGEHGDGIPFDGPSGTLAHAYFPQYGGDAHFDEDEQFTSGTSRGINLFQVAVHEIGHSLGLSHSDVPEALMAPFYTGYQPNFMLHSDDIAGIQAIYGRPPPPTTTTQRTSTDRSTLPTILTTTTTRRTTTSMSSATVPPDFDYCTDGQFDAITTLPNNMTYAFRGDMYFKILNTGIDASSPRMISADWGGLPDNIDAAFYLEAQYDYFYRWSFQNGRFTIKKERRIRREAVNWFFKGSQCWSVVNFFLNGPFDISDKFPGLPNNIDAAWVWSGNQKVYISKGDQYYRLASDNSVVRGYPRDLSIWGNIDKLSAATQWINGRTYFFVDKQYYRYNDRAFEFDRSYPRKISEWWLGCRSTGNVQNNMSEEMDAEQEFMMVTSANNATDSETDRDDVNGVARVTTSWLLSGLLCILVTLFW